ncbi:MAG: S26 family signal peptidase [Alphaproteobacteria bacterium]|nr:S26 family signal peptidase [Alphaproteobacteria bacterium]
MNQKATLIWAVFTFLFLLPTVTFKAFDLKVIHNGSSSLKGRVFVLQKRAPIRIQKGDLVVFRHDLFKGMLLLKRVSNLSGEEYQAANTLFYVGKSNTQPLVPQDHVAVTGDHLRSFDSRYARFGFVSKASILGKAWKIW